MQRVGGAMLAICGRVRCHDGNEEHEDEEWGDHGRAENTWDVVLVTEFLGLSS